MDIFELAELFVEELYCEDIQKAARILRSNQQPMLTMFPGNDLKQEMIS